MLARRIRQINNSLVRCILCNSILVLDSIIQYDLGCFLFEVVVLPFIEMMDYQE